jgi:hypothetical protein
MKLVWLIKMCLNETCSKVRIGKNLSAFPIQKGLKQRDGLLPLLFNFSLEYAIGGSKKVGGIGIEWNTSAPGLC